MTAAQAGGTPSVVASTTSTSASHDSRDAASDDGGRDWLGAVIGGGLLALAGWTLWRSARVRTRYDERRDDPDLRRDDPDMRRDDPDEI